MWLAAVSARDDGRGRGDRDGDGDGDGGDYSDPGYMVGCDQGGKGSSDNDDMIREHHPYQSRGHVHGHGKYMCLLCALSLIVMHLLFLVSIITILFQLISK